MLADTNDPTPVFVWFVILILIVVAGYFAVTWFRNRLTQDAEPASGSGFSLAQLRELHQAGKLSAEEYERAKARVLASATPADKPPVPRKPA